MTDTTHRLDDYDYHLPPDQIAQYPTAQRDQSRLLVLDAGKGDLAHRRFTDITDWLRPGDLMVVNTTRVFPARLLGRKESGGRAELFLLGFGAVVLPTFSTGGDQFGRRTIRQLTHIIDVLAEHREHLRQDMVLSNARRAGRTSPGL